MTGYPVRFTCQEERQQPVLAKEMSVAIALILNELIFNAVKHSDKQANTPVQVDLKCTSDQAMVAIINKSSSLPHGFDLSNTRGLGTGLSLVKSLLPKQGAKLNIHHEADAVITTIFLSPPTCKDIE
jgi:two-component sensor histidine kinase